METGETKESLGLSHDWFLKRPVDFEHKKYILLKYLKDVEEQFEIGKIYPYFTQVAFHLSSSQMYVQKGRILKTRKPHINVDDEMMIYDILEKTPRYKYTPEEEKELLKIAEFANGKFWEFFAIAKSLWSLAYENIEIKLKKNKERLHWGVGIVYLKNPMDQKLYVWMYKMEKTHPKHSDFKCVLDLIYLTDKDITMSKLNEHIEEKYRDYFNRIPVFELISYQNFPLSETVLPIFKRKVMSYVFQTVKESLLLSDEKKEA